MKLAFCISALITLAAPAAAGAFAFSATPMIERPQLEPVRGKKSVIDKSCLMICEKWGEHDCEKWVMKCKGDPGYPKGLTLQQ